MPRPLPVTTSTFRDIIENGFLYVDKTRYLYDLIRYPKGGLFAGANFDSEQRKVTEWKTEEVPHD
ncbi:MAG: hypothetical protein R3E79_57275 [Caldilineaceae bacterium]